MDRQNSYRACMTIQNAPAVSTNHRPRPTGEPQENQEPQLRQLRILSAIHSFSSSEVESVILFIILVNTVYLRPALTDEPSLR
jgi:hypothetical protein